MACETRPNRYVHSPHDIEAIAKELGLSFVLNPTDPRFRKYRTRDPDVVYLVKAETVRSEIHMTKSDAVLFWHGVGHRIWWSKITKSSIREIFMRAVDPPKYSLCYEKPNLLETSGGCSQCNITTCSLCHAKMLLTDNGVERIMHGQTTLNFRCCGCRQEGAADMRTLCSKIIGKLSAFSLKQQEALSFLRINDLNFEKNRVLLQKEFKMRDHVMTTSFKKGSSIKLCGLSKTGWNGQEAVIIGERILKNGTIGWPVRVKGSKSTALLKTCNLKKIKKL